MGRAGCVGGGSGVFVGGGFGVFVGGGSGVFVGGGGGVFVGRGFGRLVGGGSGVFVGSGGGVFVGGGGFVGKGVGVSVGSVGVYEGVGVKVGEDDAVGSGSHEVGLGDGVREGRMTSVPTIQNSLISGFSPDVAYISQHVGIVSVSSSSSQVTAPSSTARCVVSLLMLIFALKGMLKTAMGQTGVMNSYEGSRAMSRKLPSCIISCRRGKVCGFRASSVAPGASSSILPSPSENC